MAPVPERDIRPEVKRINERRELAGRIGQVHVGEQSQTTARCEHSRSHRRSLAAIRFRRNHDVGPGSPSRLCCAVGRTIVDDDNLESALQSLISTQGGTDLRHCGADEVRSLVCRHDDRDFRRRGAQLPSPSFRIERAGSRRAAEPRRRPHGDQSQRGRSEQRRQPGEVFDRRGAVGELNVGIGGDYDHPVGCYPVGPLGAAHRPIRKVRHLHQYRHAGSVHRERQPVPSRGDLVDLHRRQCSPWCRAESRQRTRRAAGAAGRRQQ